MKKYIKYLITLTLVIMCLTPTFANDIKVDNLEHTSIREVNELFYELTDGIINHNSLVLANDIFTPEVKRDLSILLVNNTIGGTINNVVVDFTYPENSSTGDTVIMVNSKISYEDGKYNKLYLFEYHVNADGKIYGYNMWVY